ncbi:hypothetical protein AC249_AIPGENE28772 [Exaiptasia diaphana]|nr:hypothetical protein AC249_AIPGENE28772 [Exaiptasia diaphana]
MKQPPQQEVQNVLTMGKYSMRIDLKRKESVNESASAASSSSTATPTISLSTLNKKVSDAELLWALNCVSSHASAHSNAGMNELFKTMFSDSEIASHYSLSAIKYRYLTTFGRGPHFAKQLLNEVKESPAHMFDESLNTQLQNNQLDAHVRYWSEELSCVKSRYLTSIFVGHGTADNLIEHYSELTKDLDPAKTWQIGMDGPNVNISFHRKLSEQRAEPQMASLLDIGTCGLHTVHRAFQTGGETTDWKFDQYFTKRHKLFKDYPAGREDFTQYTGTTVFPMKFCNHRWLQNGDFVSRSLAVLPHIKEYCREATIVDINT